jgi:hypothetical protein
MPRSELAVQAVSRQGLDPNYTAANVDGHSVQNDGRMLLHVKNGATAVVVTLDIARTVDGQAVVDPTVTVPDSEERFIGPFPAEPYNQGATAGDVLHVDFDDISNVTIAALRI